MQRIRTQRDAEPIGEALRRLPLGIAQRLGHVQFVAGVDPVFIGLHDTEQASYGRSYRETAHVCWPMHLDARPLAERVTTVVLPAPREPWVIIHELGHALDEAIGFDHHDPDPVTWYAETDTSEAFAEAFTAWLCPDEPRYADAPRDVLLRDEQTLALFDALARTD